MKVSRNLVVAMENCDFSGLNEAEIKLIENFPEFAVIDWGDDSNDINGICRVTRLHDRCVEIELV